MRSWSTDLVPLLPAVTRIVAPEVSTPISLGPVDMSPHVAKETLWMSLQA